MTRKDYEAFAKILKEQRDRGLHDTPFESEFDIGYRVATDQAILEIADLFTRDNPRFDRARFLKACGVE